MHQDTFPIFIRTHLHSHILELSRAVTSRVSSSPILSALIKLNVMKLSACLNVSSSVIGQDRLNIPFKGIHPQPLATR